MSNDGHPSLIGSTLGNRYVVERLLGTGAAGTVFCARQINLGTLVAIKVLHPQHATDPSLVERFEREAVSTSRLDHPNALRVLDFGQDGDLLYFVTEYVEAQNLLTVMDAEWPFTDERIVAILSQVLGALIAVHEIGIVHRDLKPENILVLAENADDGAKIDVVKVCDFGIAKFGRPTMPQSRSFAPHHTTQGMVVGTPAYMSPEQACGHAVDGRSDLYSVGVVLYHLLAGRTPFTADSPMGVAIKQVSEAPVPPSHYWNVHPALEAICLHALNKRPEDRFQTASDMRKALRNALTTGSTAALVSSQGARFPVAPDFPTSSPPVPYPRESNAPGFRENKRKRLAFGYVAVVSVAATASAFIAFRRSSADSVEVADRVEMASTLVSPPEPITEPTPSLTPETTIEAEPGTAAGAPPPAPPPTIAPLKRFATRGRPQLATKYQAPRSPVAAAPAASPISTVSPASTGAVVLIRADPWPTADAPGPPPPLAFLPVSIVPPASLDTGSASMAFSGIVVSAGISGAKVRSALSHVPLLACYKDTFRSRPSDVPLETALRLTIDITGHVVSASLSRDGDLDGFRGCIESAARGAHIRGVDTGDGFSTVQLRFSPR